MKRILGVAALALFSSVASGQEVKVTLTEWKMRLSADTVPAGRVTFAITNRGSMNHAFHVKGTGLDKETREIPANQVGTLTVTLKPGTYELFCPLAGGTHMMAGMKNTIVVTGTAAKPAARKKP